jgi:hypothetical protein
MDDLSSFNATVRKWADRQPLKYRKTALAFGYRCDRRTHSFDGTLQWISKKSRERPGEGVSVPTLQRHLKVFSSQGVIEVERRRNDGGMNMSSVYYVNFGMVLLDDRDAYLVSLGEPDGDGWTA